MSENRRKPVLEFLDLPTLLQFSVLLAISELTLGLSRFYHSHLSP